jgi:ankyrin repeat protein
VTEPSDPAASLDAETVAFAGRMFELARNGDEAALTEQVDAGLPVNLTNDRGDTLLILAAYHQHAATVRALLERGADTSPVNDRGQTALAAAVFRRSVEIVTALLAAGADPDAGSPSARETATFFELPEMSDLLPPRHG